MAQVAWPPAGRLVLDAGAIIALGHGDPRARHVLRTLSQRGFHVLIPAVVVAQVFRPGGRNAAVHRVLNAVGTVEQEDDGLAREAGRLLGATGMSDAVDALVAAHAMQALPAVILTSDPADIRTLIAADPAHARVSVVPV